MATRNYRCTVGAKMDWSYVAGYFDGEGHVSLHLTKRGTRTCGLYWFNSDWPSLKAMADFVGGTVAERGPSSGFGGRKPRYVMWVTRKAALLPVLDALIPLLIIKRAQAEALRAYLIDHVDETRMANFGKVAAVSTGQLEAWYASGGSLGDIARRLGVHHTAVMQAFRVRGLQVRTQAIATGLRQKGVPKSAETRARMLVSRRALWADPAFRARQAEIRAKRAAA